MKRLNITISDELIQSMQGIPNKSQFIREAVKEKIKLMRKEKMDALLVKGYKAARKEDIEIGKEWEGATLENWK